MCIRDRDMDWVIIPNIDLNVMLYVFLYTTKVSRTTVSYTHLDVYKRQILFTVLRTHLLQTEYRDKTTKIRSHLSNLVFCSFSVNRPAFVTAYKQSKDIMLREPVKYKESSLRSTCV